MSYVIAAQELMTSAATELASIGSNVSAAHMAAAPPTTGIVVAAEDEVSAGVAHLFSRYAQDFQALSAQAAAFHAQFVRGLNAAGGAYAAAEAANASSLQAGLAIAPATSQSPRSLLIGLIVSQLEADVHYLDLMGAYRLAEGVHAVGELAQKVSLLVPAPILDQLNWHPSPPPLPPPPIPPWPPPSPPPPPPPVLTPQIFFLEWLLWALGHGGLPILT
jgi:hypothetical protein